MPYQSPRLPFQSLPLPRLIGGKSPLSHGRGWSCGLSALLVPCLLLAEMGFATGMLWASGGTCGQLLLGFWLPRVPITSLLPAGGVQLQAGSHQHHVPEGRLVARDRQDVPAAYEVPHCLLPQGCRVSSSPHSRSIMALGAGGVWGEQGDPSSGILPVGTGGWWAVQAPSQTKQDLLFADG